MKRLALLPLLAIVHSFVAHATAATTIVAFDDEYAKNGVYSNPGTFYQAMDGVTISGNYSGVVGGIGNGDPGNWGLYGTNGSAFLGTNQSNNSLTFTFTQAVTFFTIDIGVRANGGTVGLTATGYNGGTAVGTAMNFVETAGSAANGTWGTLSYGSTPITSITLLPTSGVSTTTAYGYDNATFTPSAVPEPSAWFLLLAGLGLLASVKRWRGRDEV